MLKIILRFFLYGVVGILLAGCAEPNEKKAAQSDLANEASYWIKIDSKDSFLLRSKSVDTADSDGRGPEYCSLYKGSKYPVYHKPAAAGDGYVEVNVVDYTQKGCGFSKGFVRQVDIADMSHSIVDGGETTLKSFPLTHTPKRDYVSHPRKFGSSRSNGTRLHAGADLYSSTSTNVRAIADGRILDYHYFYDGTYAVVVSHPAAKGTKVIRYGEVGSLAPGVKVGQTVVKGQSLAQVGRLNCCHPMLHFEAFSGDRSGPLKGTGPYRRRGDLVNPTKTLQLLQAASGL